MVCLCVALAAWHFWNVRQTAKNGDAGASASVKKSAPRPLADLLQARANEKRKPVTAVLPDNLRVISGERKVSYEERLATVHRLGNNLNASEIRALLEFLRQPLAESGMETTAFNALKNDTAAALLRQEPPVPGLTEALVEMYRDKDNDIVWRSYCVQYIGSCYEREGAQSLVTNALWEATAEKQTPVAGTALLMLEYLSAHHEEVNRSRALELSENLAMDQQSCPANRITALSLCGRMGSTNVLAETRRMAADEQDAVLRMVAIATVGYLGDETDVKALEDYAQEKDSRIKKSAAGAIKRLHERLAAINQ